jgi:hypothetical protein
VNPHRLTFAVGQVIGRFTVLGPASPNRWGKSRSRVRCECGTERVVCNSPLANGRRLSCGCLRADRTREVSTKHGHGNRSGARSREYSSWLHAKSRCFDPHHQSYADYGGRGITMAAEWREDFAAFLAYIGPCPEGCSIDRIDTNGNYEPGNVRWATRFEQSRNTRRSRFVTVNGRRMTITDAAAETGICDETLRRRLGLSVAGRRGGYGPSWTIRGVVIALASAGQ